MSGLCRACLAPASGAGCASCGSSRIVTHPELETLSLAHVDCDAFYASIEKRDRPELASKPVIVGGAGRGVVTTACYIARAFGVRSAMPTFKALRLCPDAVVIKPDMARYRREGLMIRERLERLTPHVEPVSIDEAYLDLAGIDALHGAPPASVLARLQNEIEAEQGLTVSIGLSYARYLAKIASDLDKPRGFCVLGRTDAPILLAPMRVAALPGVGPVAAKALTQAGFRVIGDLARADRKALAARFGDWGETLHDYARGLDDRRVDPPGQRKSLSAESTFSEDLSDPEALADRLWPLCERVAARAREASAAGWTVTLKLKTVQFRALTRRRRLPEPTRLAQRLFETGRALMAADVDGRTRFRLIGIGLSDLAPTQDADRGDLLDQSAPRRAAIEDAVARARARFGSASVLSGRTLRTRRDY